MNGNFEAGQESPVPEKVLTKRNIFLALAGVIFLILYFIFAAAPVGFPENQMIGVKEGMTLSETALFLKERSVIRSPNTLRGIVFLSGKQAHVAAGDYLFTKPENVFTVARRLMTGEYDLTPIKVTIPEGTASFDMLKFFGREFYNFSAEEFLKITKGKEGYLFPDTYFIYPNVQTAEMVKILTANFEQKTKEIKADVALSDKKFEDIIIMASIIEKEVRKSEDQKLVSGILWKRISIGMALQVDAPFAYVSDKSTHELSIIDLATTSPYNTYKYRGLPPGPISNPGLAAISAAINPTESNYLYYLSDRSGVTHYATTFEEHKKNKALYLNK